MARTKLPALVSVAEIAALAGVQPNTVAQWHKREKLPAPVTRLGIGPIWLEADIKAWLRRQR